MSKFSKIINSGETTYLLHSKNHQNETVFKNHYGIRNIEKRALFQCGIIYLENIILELDQPVMNPNANKQIPNRCKLCNIKVH